MTQRERNIEAQMKWISEEATLAAQEREALEVVGVSNPTANETVCGKLICLSDEELQEIEL